MPTFSFNVDGQPLGTRNRFPADDEALATTRVAFGFLHGRPNAEHPFDGGYGSALSRRPVRPDWRGGNIHIGYRVYSNIFSRPLSSDILAHQTAGEGVSQSLVLNEVVKRVLVVSLFPRTHDHDMYPTVSPSRFAVFP